VIAYDSVDEAVGIANGTAYGLGAHEQGRDLGAARAVAARIRSGQVHINHPAWNPEAPFGGYKRSGNGREYGIAGLEEYLETKAISVSQMARRLALPQRQHSIHRAMRRSNHDRGPRAAPRRRRTRLNYFSHGGVRQ
jgi:hypothetical protein